jgi:HPt (histidine-containing phosphotransfer) domain-containing protein
MKLSQAEIEAQLAEIRRSYIASLEPKRDAIVTQWTSLCEQWDNETYQSLYLVIHSLAGSAETFGLADITANARKVVNQFKLQAKQQPPGAQVIPTITADIQQLVVSMNKGLSELET